MTVAPVALQQPDAGAEHREGGDLESGAERAHPAKCQSHSEICRGRSLGHEGTLLRSRRLGCDVYVAVAIILVWSAGTDVVCSRHATRSRESGAESVEPGAACAAQRRRAEW